MFKLFKIELSRAFRNRMFLITAALGALLAVWNIITDAVRASQQIVSTTMNAVVYPASVFNTWMSFRSDSLQTELFYVLMPILAVLPFADSFYLDRTSGYLKNVFIRTKKRNYYFAKYGAVFLSGAAGVTIPLLLNLAMTALLVPSVPPEPATPLFAINALFMGNGLLVAHPYVYCFVILLMTAVFGGLFAVLSIALTDLIGNRFAILLAPSLLYLFTKYIVGWVDAECLHPYFFLRADQGLVPNTSAVIILTEIAVLVAVTVLLFIVKGIKNETY